MNTDTPETDVAWNCFKGYIEPLQDVKELSRKLERERDEARAMSRDMRNQLERDSRAKLIFPWENEIAQTRAQKESK